MERFGREERLKGRDDIQAVFKHGKQVNCAGAKLFFLDNGRAANRIMFTFPRKFGNAVQRNRARRLGREAYRLSRCSVKTGYDLVLLVYPRESPVKETREVRKGQLSVLFSKAGLSLC
jgi:ribonuclease P protein component